MYSRCYKINERKFRSIVIIIIIFSVSCFGIIDTSEAALGIDLRAENEVDYEEYELNSNLNSKNNKFDDKVGKKIVDNLILNKSINEVLDENNNSTGEYEIEFSIGKVGTEIVFVIDNSYSLGQGIKWTVSIRPKIEEQIKGLMKLANENKIKVKIGIVVMSGKSQSRGSINDATIVQEFSEDIEEITNSLKGINKFGGQGTSSGNNSRVDVLNIEAGLLRTEEMFSEENSSKYVILYADGPPTISIGEMYSGSSGAMGGTKTYEEFRNATFDARDKLQEKGVGILAFGEKTKENEYWYDDAGNMKVKENMIETLSGITNVNVEEFVSIEDYKKLFFVDEKTIDLSGDLKRLFDRVKTYIERSVLEYHEKLDDIYKLSISEDIGEDFVINFDGYGEGKVALISNDNNEYKLDLDDSKDNILITSNKKDVDSLIDNDISLNSGANVSVSSDGRKIFFNDVSVNDYGTTIKYKIKLKDEYLIKDNILSDLSSVVSCEDYSEKLFKNPILNIKPSIATISVIGSNLSNSNESNVEDEVDLGEIIIENLDTKEVFKFNFSENNVFSYDFIMRKKVNEVSEIYDNNLISNAKTNSGSDSDSDSANNLVGKDDNKGTIDNYNADYIGEWLNVGEFRVKEIRLPDKMEEVGVRVNGKSIDFKKIDLDDIAFENIEIDNTFFINKQNPNVKIEVAFRKSVPKIKGKLNIETITLNGDLASNYSEKGDINLRLVSLDDETKYSFNLGLNSTLNSEFYIVDNYYEIPRNMEIGLGIIKAGKYRLEEVVPMNVILSNIEIKYSENGQWAKLSSNGFIEISKEVDDIFIRLNHKSNNKKYWFKRS